MGSSPIGIELLVFALRHRIKEQQTGRSLVLHPENCKQPGHLVNSITTIRRRVVSDRPGNTAATGIYVRDETTVLIFRDHLYV